MKEVRNAGIPAYMQVERQTCREADWSTGRQRTDTQGERHTDMQRQTDCQAGRQADKLARCLAGWQVNKYVGMYYVKNIYC